MGCCGAIGWNEEVFVPRRKRGCTDLLCLLFILGAWAAMGVVVAASINRQPTLLWSLVYPKDDYDQFCGRPGTDVEHLPKKMFPDLDGDFQRQIDFLKTAQFYQYYKLDLTGLCTEACPEGTSLSEPIDVYGGPDYPVPADFGSGEVEVPTYHYTFKTREVLNYCLPLSNEWAAGDVELCVTPNCTVTGEECAEIPSRPEEKGTWIVCPTGTSADACDQNRARCEYIVRETTTQNFVPLEATTESTSYTKRFGSFLAIILGAYDSVLDQSWLVIALGVLMPIGLGFVWLICLFFFAALIVYSLIILLVVGMIVFTLILCLKAGLVPEEGVNALTQAVELVTEGNTTEIITANVIEQGDDAHQYYYFVAAIVSGILTVIIIVFLLFSFKSINRSIAVVEETTKVFKSLPILMVWPILPLILAIGVSIFGVLGLYFVAYPTVWDDATKSVCFAILYILGILWTLEFIQAAHYASVASATAYWYVNDSSKEPGCCHAGIGCCRMIDATWTIVSRHLGSMAFGSLIIAVCQLIRLVLHAVDEATKDKQEKNHLLKLLMKCAQCAMWCLQKTIEFISHYSYVFIAIDGTTFCRGCRDTFRLIGSYPAQTAINQAVKKFLSTLIAWSTPVFCAVLCFFILDGDAEFKADYAPLYPALTVFVGAFLLSVGITTVLESAIDTIYLCAFKDMEANKGGPLFMSDDLREAFGLDKAQHEAGKDAEFYTPAGQRRAAAQPNGVDFASP